MCCFYAILIFLGPRAAIVVWWLYDQTRWNIVFDTFIFPFLGFLFVPWTTLIYVLIAPGGLDGFEWVLLALGVVADIASYASSGYGNRQRIPGYGNA